MNPELVLKREQAADCFEIGKHIDDFRSGKSFPQIIMTITKMVLDERECEVITLRRQKTPYSQVAKRFKITENHARTIEDKAWIKVRTRANLLYKLNS